MRQENKIDVLHSRDLEASVFCNMGQAVSRRSLTKTKFRLQASKYGICGRQSGTEIVFLFAVRHIPSPLLQASRPALGPTKPPVEVKRPSRDLTAHLHLVPRIKSVALHLHSPIRHDVDRDSVQDHSTWTMTTPSVRASNGASRAYRRIVRAGTTPLDNKTMVKQLQCSSNTNVHNNWF